MGDRLFGRDIVLNVGGLRIASRLLPETRERIGLEGGEQSNLLAVGFDITKSLSKDPNEADIQIINLNPESRAFLQDSEAEISLEAGHIDNTSVLLRGTLEYANSVLDGLEWITSLQVSDGSQKMKSARINKSFKGVSSVGQVLKAVVDATGLKSGNVPDIIAKGSVRGKIQFANGFAASGKAYKVLGQIAKTMGYAVSVQDGQVLMLAKPAISRSSLFRGTKAVALTPGTGLIGSPEAGEKGFVNAVAIIQPEILPGYRVKIQAGRVDGFYRIDRSNFVGDTWGDNWLANLECRPLGGTS